MQEPQENVDLHVTAGFGHEWSTFTQNETDFSSGDRTAIFESYFQIFPWSELPPNAQGLDLGCGTGRWSLLVAPKVRHLHLLDASASALAVAKQNLAQMPNVSFHLASVSNIPIEDASLDFAFSLGVLHHVPNTMKALRSVAAKLKPGAPFLIYLYYALDNRPWWYRAIWRISNLIRLAVSRMPPKARLVISRIIAATIYWPLARLAATLERAGYSSNALPLAYYRDLTFYVMRTDAYDRFCTRLEQRFTRREIEQMLTDAGFDKICFSEREPYWCAVSRKT
jgi:ubiquinone/menaquinone biosynthesis C-methylase UbiE